MAADNLITSENSLGESGEEKTPSQEDYYRVVKPLRTYERDMAESIREKQTSKVDIRLKEESRARERHEAPARKDNANPSRKFVLLFFTLVLLAAISFSVWFYLPKKSATKTPPTARIETLTKVDSIIPINTAGKSWGNIIDEFKNHQSVLSLFSDKIVLFIPATTAEEFLKEMNVEAPSSFLRALGKKINLGYYQSGEELLPFMIIEVEDFENAFAGMFLWEKNLPFNLNFFFPYQETNRVFEDLSINDRDLRILRNQNGEIIILYSFLDKKTLFVANSEIVLKEILERNK